MIGSGSDMQLPELRLIHLSTSAILVVQGGSTSLMHAVAEGHLAVVQCLLEHGAHLEAANMVR